MEKAREWQEELEQLRAEIARLHSKEVRYKNMVEDAQQGREAAERDMATLQAQVDRFKDDLAEHQRIQAAARAGTEAAAAARDRALATAKAHLAALTEAASNVLTTRDLPALAAVINGMAGVLDGPCGPQIAATAHSPGVAGLYGPRAPAAPTSVTAAALERASLHLRGGAQAAGASGHAMTGVGQPARTPMALTPEAVQQMTTAQLYTQYMEVVEALRQENAKVEMERDEKVMAQRKQIGLEGAVADQQRQVVTLTAELLRWQRGVLPPPAATSPAKALSAEDMMSANVIDLHLVTFNTVQDLVDKNRVLRQLTRDFSADLERGEELRAGMAAQAAATEAELRQELASQQELVRSLTIASQRSTTLVKTLQAEIDNTRSQAASAVSDMQMSELRGHLSAAMSEGQRVVQRGEAAELRLAEITQQLASEKAVVQAAALEKARVEGMHLAAQHRITELQLQLGNLQDQLDNTRQRALTLEMDVSAARAAAERAGVEMAAAYADRGRLQGEAMLAAGLKDSAESSLKAAQEEHKARVAQLTTEIDTQKANYQTLQSKYDTEMSYNRKATSAAGEQVQLALIEAGEQRSSKSHYESALSQAKEQVSELQSTVAMLRQQLADVRAGRRGVGPDVVNVARLAEAVGHTLEVQDDLTSARERLAASEERVAKLERDLSDLRDASDTLAAQRVAEKDAAEQAVRAAAATQAQLEKQLRDLQDRLRVTAAEAQQAVQQLKDSEEGRTEERELGQVRADLSHRAARSANADAEVARLSEQVREARTRLDHELDERSKDLQARQDAEAALMAERNTNVQLRGQATATTTASEQGSVSGQSSRVALHQDLEAAKNKVADLTAANETLMGHVNRILGDAKPPDLNMSGGQYKELVDYLSHDRAMKQTQLALLSDEGTRHKADREEAIQQVAGLRQQISSLQGMVAQGQASLQAQIATLEAERDVWSRHLGAVRADLAAEREESARQTARANELDQKCDQLQAVVDEFEGSIMVHAIQLDAAKRLEHHWHNKYTSLLQRCGRLAPEVPQESQTDLAAARQQLEAANQERDAAHQERDAKVQLVDQLTAALHKSEELLSAVQQEVDRLKRDLADKATACDRLDTEVQALRASKGVGAAQAARSAQEAREATARAAALEKQLGEAQAALTEAQAARDAAAAASNQAEQTSSLAHKLQGAKTEAGRLRDQLLSAQTQLTEVQAQLVAAQSELAGAKSQLEAVERKRREAALKRKSSSMEGPATGSMAPVTKLQKQQQQQRHSAASTMPQAQQPLAAAAAPQPTPAASPLPPHGLQPSAPATMSAMPPHLASRAGPFPVSQQTPPLTSPAARTRVPVAAPDAVPPAALPLQLQQQGAPPAVRPPPSSPPAAKRQAISSTTTGQPIRPPTAAIHVTGTAADSAAAQLAAVQSAATAPAAAAVIPAAPAPTAPAAASLPAPASATTITPNAALSVAVPAAPAVLPSPATTVTAPTAAAVATSQAAAALPAAAAPSPAPVVATAAVLAAAATAGDAKMVDASAAAAAAAAAVVDAAQPADRLLLSTPVSTSQVHASGRSLVVSLPAPATALGATMVPAISASAPAAFPTTPWAAPALASAVPVMPAAAGVATPPQSVPAVVSTSATGDVHLVDASAVAAAAPPAAAQGLEGTAGEEEGAAPAAPAPAAEATAMDEGTDVGAGVKEEEEELPVGELAADRAHEAGGEEGGLNSPAAGLLRAYSWGSGLDSPGVQAGRDADGLPGREAARPSPLGPHQLDARMAGGEAEEAGEDDGGHPMEDASSEGEQGAEQRSDGEAGSTTESGEVDDDDDNDDEVMNPTLAGLKLRAMASAEKRNTPPLSSPQRGTPPRLGASMDGAASHSQDQRMSEPGGGLCGGAAGDDQVEGPASRVSPQPKGVDGEGDDEEEQLSYGKEEEEEGLLFNEGDPSGGGATPSQAVTDAGDDGVAGGSGDMMDGEEAGEDAAAAGAGQGPARRALWWEQNVAQAGSTSLPAGVHARQEASVPMMGAADGLGEGGQRRLPIPCPPPRKQQAPATSPGVAPVDAGACVGIWGPVQGSVQAGGSPHQLWRAPMVGQGAWDVSWGRGASPQGRGASPQGRGASPRGGGASPRGRFASPRGGGASPRGGGASPRGGLASPRGGLASPGRSGASPLGRGASPQGRGAGFHGRGGSPWGRGRGARGGSGGCGVGQPAFPEYEGH